MHRLKKEILALQGFKPAANDKVDIPLGPINNAFPNQIFPLGAIHEFLVPSAECGSASAGFIAGIISAIMRGRGVLLWISASRALFPPAVSLFGIKPEHIIFISLRKEKDVLWAMEEALKCEGLAAVVAETASLGFTASRRLQLSVEESRVTGFILLHKPANQGTTACVTRWQISSLPSQLPDELPGVGFPRWKVDLLKVRNGKPGSWEVEWVDGAFRQVAKEAIAPQQAQRKAG